MTDIYVGIDPGVSNCAVVAFSPTKGLVEAWKPKGSIPAGVMRLRYLMVHIDGAMRRFKGEGQILQVAVEHYSMAEKYGQHASGEVGGTIKLTLLTYFGADDRRAFPLLVAPQQLKKFVAGNGNIKKSMIPKEVYKRWGEDFNDENLAEAYGLARMAHAFDADPDMTQFQRDVMKNLVGRTEWVPPLPERKRRLVRPAR
jgi:Holliday junction resolvasome RuvABC endonuclease subunit